jgi:hypothetical protein
MPTAVEQMRRSKWPSLYSRCSLPALLLCAACSASHPGPGTVREGELPRAREGYVPGAGGVRLFYRVDGSGPDTIVVLHGGPGLNLEGLRPDLERQLRWGGREKGSSSA